MTTSELNTAFAIIETAVRTVDHHDAAVALHERVEHLLNSVVERRREFERQKIAAAGA